MSNSQLDTIYVGNSWTPIPGRKTKDPYFSSLDEKRQGNITSLSVSVVKIIQKQVYHSKTAITPTLHYLASGYSSTASKRLYDHAKRFINAVGIAEKLS